jgi:uncharacterized protein YbjT (DUF2867 family)
MAAGHKVRVLLREDTRNPFGDAVEVARGHYDDLASLRAAADGIDAAYLVLPTTITRDELQRWGRNVIDAAVGAGVPRMVMNTSSVGAASRVGVAAIDGKVDLETHLQSAAIPSVILRTTIYMDNLTGPWIAPAMVADGVLAMPLPAGQAVSWISWAEAANYAVAALQNDELAVRKPILQTGGSHAITGTEVAAILSDVLARRIDYVQVPIADFEAALTAQFGALGASDIAGYYKWVTDPAQQNPLDVDLAPLRAELPVPQVDFASWARRTPWRMLAGAS